MSDHNAYAAEYRRRWGLRLVSLIEQVHRPFCDLAHHLFLGLEDDEHFDHDEFRFVENAAMGWLDDLRHLDGFADHLSGSPNDPECDSWSPGDPRPDPDDTTTNDTDFEEELF